MDTPAPIVVFVHGILSDGPSAFGPMVTSLREDSRFSNWQLRYFNYPYNKPLIHNASQFASLLRSLEPVRPIHLVCHSMGGLIARLAILSGTLPGIKRLIMLGTPNFGAFRTSSLGLLSQAAVATADKIFALFPSVGIWELTKVSEILREHLDSGNRHAEPVEYVTIPGLYFHEERRSLSIKDPGDKAIWTTFFRSIDASSQAIEAIFPLWKLSLRKPHDGIVEETSNSLFPANAWRRSEKRAAIRRASEGWFSYSHVVADRCVELSHVTLQKDKEIIDLVKSLLLAQTLPAWHQSLPQEIQDSISVTYRNVE